MAQTHKPTIVTELSGILAEAVAARTPVELRGGGSKAAMGRPGRTTTLIDMSAFNAVIDYDPKELVLTIGAGARLSDVEMLVAAENQMLAFEPFDHGPIFGKPSGAATIGGIVAANVSGSRRMASGAARDHVLGIEGVSGRGEAFKGGGRVVKNVTGYDVPKLMTGSWGRLAALTAVTLKVLPRPRTCATVLVRGLTDEHAATVMAKAAGSTAEVSGAAHVPSSGGDPATTALRLEGFGPSVTARAAALTAALRSHGPVEMRDAEKSETFWRRVRDLEPLGLLNDVLLWRINGRPSRTWKIPADLNMADTQWFYDWAGGLIWLTTPATSDASAIRRVAAAHGAHATLVRAPEAICTHVSMLQAQAPTVEALAARVKAAFDPAGILDPHRFGTAA